MSLPSVGAYHAAWQLAAALTREQIRAGARGAPGAIGGAILRDVLAALEAGATGHTAATQGPEALADDLARQARGTLEKLAPSFMRAMEDAP